MRRSLFTSKLKRIQPYQVECTNGIKIVVPVNYTNGSMVLFLQFEINAIPYCNDVSAVSAFTILDQYLDEPIGHAAMDGLLVPDKAIMKNVRNAFDYIGYCYNWLTSNNKTTPTCFEAFMGIRAVRYRIMERNRHRLPSRFMRAIGFAI